MARLPRWVALAVVASAGIRAAAAASTLQTTGFDNCGNNSDVTVQRVSIQYDNDAKTVSFDVAGTSTKVQNVTAVLNVTAYGSQVYSNTFNPCAPATFVQQLCPVPAGSFSARGSQAIPAQYANLVPAIAFQIPDIAAQATLQLRATDGGADVACLQAQVSNGKTTDVPAVSFVAAGVAGAALLLAGVSAVTAALASGGSSAAAAAAAGGGSVGGAGALSPSFGEVFGWFQGMAMNSMLSVSYPQVYRSFAKSFGFSTGLIPWNSLQLAIDNFRLATGGNLTNDSVQFLQNATLVLPGGSTVRPGSQGPFLLRPRAADHPYAQLLHRAIETSINGTDATAADSTGSMRVTVSGIQAYVEQLSIPSANTFMTVLLIVAIVIAAITVGILLVKVVLEAWALIGRFPPALAGFRKHYWRSIARAITTLILLLYGVWVLYCMFQFTQGDSWAAKVLAGVTLGLFTAVLAYFSFMIWYTAQKLKHNEGDASGLYDDKAIWVRYSLFYEAYRKPYWWLFVPTILYMSAKGVALAIGDGHGMAQTIAQLAIEAAMLVLLLWSRPYERRSGNVVNIVIQVVRVLSVVCVLVFVEEFGIAQTTQTIAGVVLIAVQSALSGILALLIAWNAVAACIKENPHRKRRKELEKARDTDNLTPLDARNSLLKPGLRKSSDEEDAIAPMPEKDAIVPMPEKDAGAAGTNASTDLAVPRFPPARRSLSADSTISASSGAVLIGLATTASNARLATASTYNNPSSFSIPRPALAAASSTRGANGDGDGGGDSLLGNVAPIGRSDAANERQPTLPNVVNPNPNTARRRPPPARGPPGYRPGSGPNYQQPPRYAYSPFPAPQRQQPPQYPGNGRGPYMGYNRGYGYGGHGNPNYSGGYPGGGYAGGGYPGGGYGGYRGAPGY